MLLAGVLIFPTVFLSNLSNIAWLSLTSIFFLNIVFVGLVFHSMSRIKEWKSESLPFVDFKGLSVANCIILFSYVAHPYLPRIEAGMKNPSYYNKVSNLAFMVATFTKIFFGMSLVCHFGNNTQQRVTNNISEPKFRIIAEAFLAVSGLFSFALPTNVIMNIIQRADVEIFAKLFPLARLRKTMSWSEMGIDLFMRVILICLSTVVAMLLPEFSILMAVFGSVTAVCLVLVFPTHFYSAMKLDYSSKSKLAINYGILIYGVGTGLIGFIHSMEALITALELSQE